jgi:hypothetical protein
MIALPVDPPLLAAPAWIWATLLMAAFVAISVLTVALARIAVRWRPAGGDARERSDRTST